MGLSFGKLCDYDGERGTPESKGHSVGGLYALSIRQHLLLGEVHAFGGGGVWVEAPAWRFVSFDVVAMDHPKNDVTSNVQDGGSTFQAYAGPKVGFRVGSVGLYAMARPGLVRFSCVNTFQGMNANGTFISTDHPKIDFSLDTGLVLQYVPKARALRHVVTRFEAGSIVDFYLDSYTDDEFRAGDSTHEDIHVCCTAAQQCVVLVRFGICLVKCVWVALERRVR